MKSMETCSGSGKAHCRTVFFLKFFLAASLAFAEPLFSQTRIIPNDGWVKIYFESIDDLTNRMGIKPLRSAEIQPGDLEVRIWSGFGLSGYGGSIIKRVSGQWSASLLSDPQGTRGINGRPVEASIKEWTGDTDWAETWGKMEQTGIEKIRDYSEIPRCGSVLDGISYVVEIAKADYYRTYMLGNPQLQRSEDGDKFLRIKSILRTAFGATDTDELAKLPTGEDRMVASFSSDTSVSGEPLGLRFDGSEWKVGSIPPEGSIIHMSSEDALAQAISLSVRSCGEMPRPRRYTYNYLPPGDVAIEIYIQPDGSVSAAKALSGPIHLAEESLQSIPRWKFAPLTGSGKIRKAVIAIRYRKEWVRFPWLNAP